MSMAAGSTTPPLLYRRWSDGSVVIGNSSGQRIVCVFFAGQLWYVRFGSTERFQALKSIPPPAFLRWSWQGRGYVESKASK